VLRVFLQFVLPLIFPTALWLVCVWFEKRRNKGQPEEGRATPWIWLISIGFALSVVSLITWGLLEGDQPDKTYTAPTLENGKVVPGKFK
jgi:heme A synthase